MLYKSLKDKKQKQSLIVKFSTCTKSKNDEKKNESRNKKKEKKKNVLTEPKRSSQPNSRSGTDMLSCKLTIETNVELKRRNQTDRILL